MSDIHAAVACYAVDALDGVERAEFEAHLDDCGRCQSELVEYRETLAELSLMVSASPPAALRDSVLAAVTGLRQVGQRRSQGAADQAGRANDHADDGEVAPRRALAPVTELRPGEPHHVAPLEEHPSLVPEGPWLGVAAALSEDMGRLNRWRNRVFGALLAVALGAALVLGGWAYVLRSQIQTSASEAQRETEVLTAPDAELYTGTLNGAQVSYVVSEQRNQVLFVGNNLDAPEPGSTYQLWIVRGDATASAGLVRGGNVREVFNAPVRTADRLVLSLEPAPRGSPTPTGPILSEVSLSPP